MRGKEEIVKQAAKYGRITPAYAGKSHALYRVVKPSRDHPRLCGEKYAAEAANCRPVGSPPPMRGKGQMILCCWIVERITPAYAGKRPDWDGLDKTAQGSPPPMRGKACLCTSLSSSCRITPAYAGKSFLFVFLKFRPPTRDHPRLCGEKFDRTLCAFCILGSPPPMRGKVNQNYSNVVQLEDHPRLCGEKWFRAFP